MKKRNEKEGFDSHKRWGNSAMKGHGVNSPAMMEARRGIETKKDGTPLRNIDFQKDMKVYELKKGKAVPHEWKKNIAKKMKGHIGDSKEHSKNCKTRNEYGNCPPWPHA